MLGYETNQLRLIQTKIRDSSFKIEQPHHIPKKDATLITTPYSRARSSRLYLFIISRNCLQSK